MSRPEKSWPVGIPLEIKGDQPYSDEVKNIITQRLGSRWERASEYVARLKNNNFELTGHREESMWAAVGILVYPKGKKMPFRDIVSAVKVWEELGIYPEHAEAKGVKEPTLR